MCNIRLGLLVYFVYFHMKTSEEKMTWSPEPLPPAGTFHLVTTYTDVRDWGSAAGSPLSIPREISATRHHDQSTHAGPDNSDTILTTASPPVPPESLSPESLH